MMELSKDGPSKTRNCAVKASQDTTGKACRCLQEVSSLLAWICFHQNKLWPTAFQPAAKHK